ncbi:uncharacterized protein LOC112596890 [Melanaphis sacchari]|uniref:uncharacterized protein LOC112596890 n=1 Tax=Melanaphis sacchari TaxID=742174 RepID=UPI000DC15650|nr:uncharacterized protein LOC112596890 [Melanaphis sacchari]
MTTECKKVPLVGRRIVDIFHIFEQIRTFRHESGFDCTFSDMEYVSEKLNGYFSTFEFKCKMCCIKMRISSENIKADYLTINKAVLNGTVAIGIGQRQLTEFSAALEMPSMANTTYSRVHKSMHSSIHDSARTEMLKAGEEERRLAIEDGDVDEDGNALCTVVADGQWGKRSYKSKYDALSGVATIIGYRTKKVLFVGIRNRYCVVCHRAALKQIEKPKHSCFKNWNKSATSIEADGVVEGFQKSIEMHNLKYNKLIGDGDSSVTKRLNEVLPYGPNFLIQKIECRNHLLRNYCQKLTAAAKKCIYPINVRRFILSNIMRFRTGIVTAIKYRKKENKPTTQQASDLANDIMNSPYHILGEHNKCDKYFCKESKTGDQNLVSIAENCGLMREINMANRRLFNNAQSLLKNVDNNICEQFNSMINKYIGGKRTNLSQKHTYNTRVEAAVIAFNSQSYLRTIHKSITNASPGTFGKRFLSDAKRIRINNCRRRILFPKNKIHLKVNGPDEDYGLSEPLIEDISEEDIKQKKIAFIKSLSEMDRSYLEKETRNQADSQLWHVERRNRITASNFGKICKMRPHTSCKNTVYGLLYGNNIQAKALDYGKSMEPYARNEFETKFGLKVSPAGLCVDSEIPYLAASPDGFVDYDSLIEIKCPYSAKDCDTIIHAIKEGKIKYCSIKNINDENITELKKTCDYYYQIQGQLHITRRNLCYFIIYSEKWISVEKIIYDEHFWSEKMLDYLKTFYMECLLPELINPQYCKRILINDIKEPDHIKKQQNKKIK